MRAAKAPVIAARSTFACSSLVKGADVAVGVGGYVSVAPILAAKRAHIPIVLLAPDAVLGLANRLLARWATAIGIAFDDARAGIHGDARVEMIGYPVRQTILDVPERRTELLAEARSVFGLSPVPADGAGDGRQSRGPPSRPGRVCFAPVLRGTGRSPARGVDRSGPRDGVGGCR